MIGRYVHISTTLDPHGQRRAYFYPAFTLHFIQAVKDIIVEHTHHYITHSYHTIAMISRYCLGMYDRLYYSRLGPMNDYSCDIKLDLILLIKYIFLYPGYSPLDICDW